MGGLCGVQRAAIAAMVKEIDWVQHCLAEETRIIQERWLARASEQDRHEGETKSGSALEKLKMVYGASLGEGSPTTRDVDMSTEQTAVGDAYSRVRCSPRRRMASPDPRGVHGGSLARRSLTPKADGGQSGMTCTGSSAGCDIKESHEKTAVNREPDERGKDGDMDWDGFGSTVSLAGLQRAQTRQCALSQRGHAFANQLVAAEPLATPLTPAGLSLCRTPLPTATQGGLTPGEADLDVDSLTGASVLDRILSPAASNAHLPVSPGIAQVARELVQQIRGCVVEVVILHAAMDAMQVSSAVRRTPPAPPPPPSHHAHARAMRQDGVAADNARLRADLEAALLEVNALEKALKASRQESSSWVIVP